MKQPTCPKKELFLGIKDCLDCKKYFFESFSLCSRKEKIDDENMDFEKEFSKLPRPQQEALRPHLEYDKEYSVKDDFLDSLINKSNKALRG